MYLTCFFYSLQAGRSERLCVLAVPNHMTGADFCQFTGAFIQNIKEMRFVRYPVLRLCCEIIDTLEGNNS